MKKLSLLLTLFSFAASLVATPEQQQDATERLFQLLMEDPYNHEAIEACLKDGAKVKRSFPKNESRPGENDYALLAFFNGVDNFKHGSYKPDYFPVKSLELLLAAGCDPTAHYSIKSYENFRNESYWYIASSSSFREKLRAYPFNDSALEMVDAWIAARDIRVKQQYEADKAAFHKKYNS